jgi:hypothetical protein
MSSNRFIVRSAMIVLLAIALVCGGCATTSSQNAEYKPHKPQMITSDGVEEVGASNVQSTFGNGFKLSDNWACALAVMGPAFQILGQFLACH